MQNSIEKERQIVPTWTPYSVAKILRNLNGFEHVNKEEKFNAEALKNYQLKFSEWTTNKNVVYATDLVGSAIILNDYGNESVKKAAEFILKDGNRASQLSVGAASNYLKFGEMNFDGEHDAPEVKSKRIERFYKKISQLKKSLREIPNNAIDWIDLAFYYTSIGQDKKAEKCIIAGESLSKENRFVLRSIARFYLHIEEGEKALRVLRNSSHLKYDPWLIASEISISEALKKNSNFIKQGKNILESEKYSDFDISELAGALGTLEIANGETKKGKKLFKIALIQPNENTLAQAVWLKTKVNLEAEINSKEYSIPCEYEADARINYWKGNYDSALLSSKKWFDFQPFSARPASVASYISAVALEDHASAIEIIKDAKNASPNDFLLNNNHVFSLASLDRLAEAKIIFNKINPPTSDLHDKAVYTATKGLLSFREGKSKEGRELYMKAVGIFKDKNDQRAQVVASYFWGLEEKRVNSKEADIILKKL